MVSRTKEIYDLFLAGKSFFHYCTPDIKFASGFDRFDDPGVHYFAGKWKGQEEIIQGFLTALGESSDMEKYEILNAGADINHPNILLVWIAWTGKGKMKGGHHCTSPSFHLFKFNNEGLVTEFQDCPDTIMSNYMTNTHKKRGT